MKSKLVVVVLLAAVIVVAVLLSTMEKHDGIRPVQTGGEPSNITQSGEKIIGGGTVSWGTQTMQVNGAQSVKPVSETPVDPEFQKFLAGEAKRVDAKHIDSSAKTKELADVVAKLTPTQAQQLLQTAQSTKASAGERILSAYLMVEAGPRAEAELKALITAPVSNPGPHAVHSEDEMRAMQERSVRAMAVDGLISRATKEALAREALAKTIPDIPDPYIKDYASKRLAEIKAH